jgi:Tol biopolymer transport system component
LALLFVLLALGATDPKAKSKTTARSPFQAESASPTLLGPGVISTGDDESHAALSPDGDRLYFLKNSPTFDHWTIVTSQWKQSQWTYPTVASFSGRWSDADPFLTEDGSKLYFISTRPVDATPKTDTDLWTVSKDASGGWGTPVHLGPNVNSPESEWFPTVTRDGTLYFGSERAGGLGGADIWRSRKVNGVYQAPENLGGPINTPAGEFEPMVSPDESFLVFAAIGKKGGLGAFDLWISFNQSGRWSDPVRLDETINSPAWDFAPRLTPDGRTLLFTSSRGSVGQALDHPVTYEELLSRLHSPGNGLRDIYYVSVSALPGRPPAATPAAPSK